MGQKTDAIIEAISPTPASVSAQNLQYNSMRDALDRFGFLSTLRKSTEVLQGKRKLPSLEDIQHDFYVAYLLNASYRLQRSRTPLERLFWSQQFSASSIQLFGRPNNRAVASLAAQELKFFERTVKRTGGQTAEFAEPLLKTYRSLTKSGKVSQSAEGHSKDALDAVHDYFFEEYGQELGVFDVYEDHAVLHPEELFDSFTKALSLLKKRDARWERWQVVMTKSSGNLSVSSRYRRISIGKRRVPVPVSEVRGLFAHEVLVHALRAVNGESYSRDVRKSLTDYLIAEEGMGVLVESAINGSISPKVKDRYLDISLAIGSYRRRVMMREELFMITYIRSVLRSLADDTPDSLEHIEKASWQHVNRIYRGSLGNKYIGVFTKDIAYYEGFVTMTQYIDKQLGQQSARTIIEHILQLKFDPTNKKHERIVSRGERT